MKKETQADDTQAYDVLVIGGGVVGLSILRSATLHGFWKCALVEAEPDLLSWASGSNSGIVCTGVDASPGTLERALIRDSVARVREFCTLHNIPTRPCGSLVCQWPWDLQSTTTTTTTDEPTNTTATSLEDVLKESHDAGDTHASILSARQVQQLEPNLSRSCIGAVHIPGEIVVDPWLFSIAYAIHARENGAKIFTNWKFDPKASNFDGTRWTAVRCGSQQNSGGPSVLKAKTIVNATGLWSADVQANTLNKFQPSNQKIPTWEARPRRGQYRVYSTNSKTMIQAPIQPIPTQRTKGIFVFSTLYDQICVGPTALDQDSLTDRSVDPVVSEELSYHAQRIIENLNTTTSFVGDYVGLRPGSDKRDYQIHLIPKMNWIASAGIRSTGLTASLGIGRHVVHLLESILTDHDASSVQPQPQSQPHSNKTMKIRTTPLPSVLSLVQQYHRRGDGSVSIGGHTYKVTHPVTRMGWTHQTGLANSNYGKTVPQQASYLSKL